MSSIEKKLTFKEFADRGKNITGNIYSLLMQKYKFIRDYFANIANVIVNSPNYKYYISILLTLVFILLVILTNLINVHNHINDYKIHIEGGRLYHFFLIKKIYA